MNIRWNDMKWRCLKIVSLFLIITTCTESTKNEDLKKYIVNDRLLVQQVLKNVPSDSDQFLLFPKDLCRKCFRHIIDHFEQQNERGHVILLGANDYDVTRLNTIYRKSLKFWKGDFEQYEALLSQYPSVVRGYVRYVEVGADTLIYEGAGDDRKEKTEDVIHFFVKRDTAGSSE